MLIRDYQPSDARALADIFYDSIHSVALEYYTQAQVDQWAPLPKDYGHWQQRLDAKPPYVAEIDGQVVGFITLEDDGHVDWTYTHRAHQRRGIAGSLYAHLEAQARAKGIRRLYVEASYLARPFFTKQGFVEVRRNDTERNGEILTNWTMEKVLAEA
ncbi:GNAT family N-acetyltransferase [Gallaecimonas sp. GXIMD4217]|uniref:GNAT family N-acetyltransferase n=1 Tax=Gallaecimonas sp. GXIMD4217 TaxID=3131927 RepID=UPI00311B21ED